MFGKWFKRKSEPDVDEFGRTPLHYAAADGDSALVQRLIAAGADGTRSTSIAGLRFILRHKQSQQPSQRN